mmetsp:Transcript_12476/g.23511  ORF Transcript_12476/g.23511 Transcript_12476/m.23511 type:complete len:209 (-) Transcript_12476:793-1419(-)
MNSRPRLCRLRGLKYGASTRDHLQATKPSPLAAVDGLQQRVELLEIQATSIQVVIGQQLGNLCRTNADTVVQEAGEQLVLVNRPIAIVVEHLKSPHGFVAFVELLFRVEIVRLLVVILFVDLFIIIVAVAFRLVLVVATVIRIWSEVCVRQANDTVHTQEVEIRVANVIVWHVAIPPVAPRGTPAVADDEDFLAVIVAHDEHRVESVL